LLPERAVAVQTLMTGAMHVRSFTALRRIG
jgi:hypothetical protein